MNKKLVGFGEWLIDNRYTKRIGNSDGIFYYKRGSISPPYKTTQELVDIYLHTYKTMQELVDIYLHNERDMSELTK